MLLVIWQDNSQLWQIWERCSIIGGSWRSLVLAISDPILSKVYIAMLHCLISLQAEISHPRNLPAVSQSQVKFRSKIHHCKLRCQGSVFQVHGWKSVPTLGSYNWLKWLSHGPSKSLNAKQKTEQAESTIDWVDWQKLENEVTSWTVCCMLRRAVLETRAWRHKVAGMTLEVVPMLSL